MNKIIARALTRTRRHAPTHVQVCTHIRALAHANACLHTPPHASTRACIHTPIHTRTPACKLPHTPTHACTHTPIHTRTRQRAFAHAYTYTCICMNLHVHTHVLDFLSLDTWMGYMTKKTSFTCPCVLSNLKKYFVLQSRFLLIVGETCNNFYYFVKILKISKVN